jgi:hypothetical protein
MHCVCRDGDWALVLVFVVMRRRVSCLPCLLNGEVEVKGLRAQSPGGVGTPLSWINRVAVRNNIPIEASLSYYCSRKGNKRNCCIKVCSRIEEVKKCRKCSAQHESRFAQQLVVVGCRTARLPLLARGQAHDNWIETVIYPGPHPNHIPCSLATPRKIPPILCATSTFQDYKLV